MDRIIKCVNRDGEEIVFDETGLNPFVIMSVQGIYTVQNNVRQKENTMINGSTYLGSTQAARNIVITLKDSRDKSDYIEDRERIDAVFTEGEGGTLHFIEGEKKRKIDYIVEHVDSTGLYHFRTHTISLICPDPSFYSENDVHVLLSEWTPGFIFPHRFKREPIARRNRTRLQTIENKNAVPRVGMRIEITGTGDIVNPLIRIAENASFIQVGSAENPFTLHYGETLVITTFVGDKHIWLVEDGVKTEINEYKAPGSSWIQLLRGNNSVGYDALSGANLMTVKITYRMQYARA